MFAFLLDFKGALLRDHLARWQMNQLLPDGGEDERRGRTLALEEIATLDLAHIRDFYGITAEETEGDT